MKALRQYAGRTSSALERFSHRRRRGPGYARRAVDAADAGAPLADPTADVGAAYQSPPQVSAAAVSALAGLYADPPRKFACTACGKCCTGAGEVWASEEECSRLAQHLQLSLPRFLARHTKSYRHRPGWHMLRSQANTDRRCVFLGDDNLCTVHSVRPLQCSTYPYWPELIDPLAWEMEALRTCEGINHESAEAVDPAHAGAQLALASAHFAARHSATRQRQPQSQQTGDALQTAESSKHL